MFSTKLRYLMLAKFTIRKKNRRFRIRLEDFRKKVIPDNEKNTVDIRVGAKNGRVGGLK